MLLLISCIAFPFLTGLMSFSQEYGYKGRDKQECITEAKFAFIGAAIISALVWCYHLWTT